jgi:hypothetical protein
MKPETINSLRCIFASLLWTGLFIATGCNGSKGDFAVAPTHGTIETVDGKTIASGRVQLSPIASDSTGKAGKAAGGEIKDGQFVLTTYGKDDGAVIGKHKVRLLEPFQAEEGDVGAGQVTKHHCEIAPESQTVEIVAGQNVLELKAVPRKRRR